MRQPAVDGLDDFAAHLIQFLVAQPHRHLAERGAVANHVDVRTVEVSVEVHQERRDKHRERLPMLVDSHGAKFVIADDRVGEVELVAPFDGPADPRLADHREHAAVREPADMSVEGGDRHVGEQRAEFPCGEFTAIEQCLDDAEPDGVQEEIGGRHLTSIAFCYIINIDNV